MKLNELSANYQKLQENYEELTANYISIKKGHRNSQWGPRRNEEYNFWIEETVEGIKSSLDEAKDQISDCLLYTSDAADERK